jgi:hypothetical protein
MKYTHRQYLGTTKEVICGYEYLPDYGGGGSGEGSNGSGTYKSDCSTDNNNRKTRYQSKENKNCAVRVTEETVECKKGYKLDKKGNCVKIVSQINNKLTNTCAKTILENLLEDNRVNPLKPNVVLVNGSTQTFSGEILDLFDNSIVLNYTFSNGNLRGTNAQTRKRGNEYSTKLSNSYLQQATNLSVARTLIHESVHAHMLYKIRYDLSFNKAMVEYAKLNGYNPKSTDKNEINRFHHNFMAQYITAIAHSLYSWDKNYNNGGNLGADYYYAMAFSGQFQVDSSGKTVTETDAFKAIVTDSVKRQEIININLKEQKGTRDAKGTKCN